MNTYRKNKEFNPVNNRCEILVMGLSSRILTKRITNISNVTYICEIKSGRNKRPCQFCVPPTPALLLPVCPHLAQGSSQRAFPSPRGWGSTFLQTPIIPIPGFLTSIPMVFAPCIHLPLDLRTFTSGFLGPDKLHLAIG